MKERQGWTFVILLLALVMLLLTPKANAESTIFVITWDPVTTTVDGQAIPPNDIEYVLYGRRGDDQFQVFLITTDTEWMGPSMPVGCYEFYAIARRIVTKLESVPSVTIGECVYPEGVDDPPLETEDPPPVVPEVDTHQPPGQVNPIKLEKRRVNW